MLYFFHKYYFNLIVIIFKNSKYKIDNYNLKGKTKLEETICLMASDIIFINISMIRNFIFSKKKKENDSLY